MGVFKLTNEDRLYPNGRSERLVVLLHAYQHQPVNLQPLADVVAATLPDADLIAPRLPVSTFSFSDPEKIAAAVVANIEKHLKPSHANITIVGHSLGATLARKVWALANGARPDATVGAPRAWGARIDVIVQLAALNRGWTSASPLTLGYRLGFLLGTCLANLARFLFRRDALALAFRRGSAFLTLSRLQCLAVERQLKGSGPQVVQLLGTADDLIAPTDNIDLATGSKFHYLEVRDATHIGIGSLSDPRAAKVFALALTGDPAQLQADSIPIDHVFDMNNDAVDDADTSTRAPVEDPTIEDVVFVIHGIRDRGFWPRRLAHDIKRNALASNKRVRTVTSTYGYFAMLPFVMPWVRRAKVEWFLDQYVTAKALYPNAKFSYVGHSNGTYLLAKALDLCRAIKVHNVVFAGSVVRTDFDWNRFETPTDGLTPQVTGSVVNYVATRDWVVALFPYAFELARMQDIGGAGHRGFGGVVPKFGNFLYVKGSHGAAIEPNRWPEIANFIINNVDPTPASHKQFWLWTALSLLSPVLLVGGAILVGWLGVQLFDAAKVGDITRLLVFGLYAWLVLVVVTKV